MWSCEGRPGQAADRGEFGDRPWTANNVAAISAVQEVAVLCGLLSNCLKNWSGANWPPQTRADRRWDAFTYEHVVIDNCSTDGTWAFLREAAANDPHVRPVQTSASRGLAHALNCGHEAASGELVLSLDDDDLLLPRTLQMHAGFMSGHPGIDWAFGRTLLIDQDGGGPAVRP